MELRFDQPLTHSRYKSRFSWKAEKRPKFGRGSRGRRCRCRCRCRRHHGRHRHHRRPRRSMGCGASKPPASDGKGSQRRKPPADVSAPVTATPHLHLETHHLRLVWTVRRAELASRALLRAGFGCLPAATSLALAASKRAFANGCWNAVTRVGLLIVCESVD